MKMFFVLALTLGFLASCSDGDSGKKSGGDQPQSENVTTMKFQESYQRILNGCDTGKHDFGSNTSYEDVKTQLCEALQDDKLNHSCAESLRKELFDQKCTGIAWNPVYEPISTPIPAPMPDTEDGVDFSTQENVKNMLRFVLVDSYEIALTLTAEEKEKITAFSEDLMSCGFSYLGPKCLTYETAFGNGGVLTRFDGQLVYYSELKLKDMESVIGIIFRLDQVQTVVKVSSVEISKVLKPKNKYRGLPEYLKDSTARSLLVKLSPAADFQSGALKRLQNPRDIRELFHLSTQLLTTSFEWQTQKEIFNLVTSAIAKNKIMITASEDVRYQEALLTFMMTMSGLEKSVLVDVCEGLINSSSDNIKQIAATIILDAQPSRTELKVLVLKALKNPRWDVRKRAIIALSKTQKNTAEEIQVIGTLSDSDGDVRETAVVAASKISVNNGHLAVVKELSANGNWFVRREAAKLLSRIDSAESIKALIGLMGDSDGDVRAQVVTLLQQKSLSAESIPALAEQMKNQNWAVRKDAALMLSKMNTDEATLILIDKLNDADGDVRGAIMKELSSKKIKDSYIGALVEKYRSQNWQTRYNVSVLLGKNSSLAATNALVRQMNDADGDVRAVISKQLAGRSLTNDSVESLKDGFSSNNWSVRKEVALFLGKIKSKESLSALEDQLTKETDGDVKKQIIDSIKAIKG